MQPLLTAYLEQTSVEIFKSKLLESMRGPYKKNCVKIPRFPEIYAF
jgi:hypothetical protein